jgi:hypothetical protein
MRGLSNYLLFATGRFVVSCRGGRVVDESRSRGAATA